MSGIETFEKHYVIFIIPGTVMNVTSNYGIASIESWDIKKATKMSDEITERYGAKPFGFKFETYREANPQKDTQGNEIQIKPERIAWSGIVYLGGKVETYDEIVARNDPSEKTLSFTMSVSENWVVVVNTTSYKYVTYFDEDDVVVNNIGDIVTRGEEYTKYRARKSAENNGKR